MLFGPTGSYKVLRSTVQSAECGVRSLSVDLSGGKGDSGLMDLGQRVCEVPPLAPSEPAPETSALRPAAAYCREIVCIRNAKLR